MSTPNPTRGHVGIAGKHRAKCASRAGSRCTCKLAYQAHVWSACDRRRIRRHFAPGCSTTTSRPRRAERWGAWSNTTTRRAGSRLRRSACLTKRTDVPLGHRREVPLVRAVLPRPVDHVLHLGVPGLGPGDAAAEDERDVVVDDPPGHRVADVRVQRLQREGLPALRAQLVGRTVGELNPAGAVKELECGKNTRPISVVVLPRALPASDIKRGCSFWWDDASFSVWLIRG